MVNITEFSVEKIKDPFGIISGERYEFLLSIDVPEDDELYTPSGVHVRVIYRVSDGQDGIVKHELLEGGTDKLLDFELEDDELAEVEAFCKEHLHEAEQ
ncbi:DUF6509 family protein [Paenibacillus turpanensis]|uniref:DUF6509 family protein n=1 Tax=Paenibacillus turpanensis TaxID=2689078 RepID=UPI00140B9A9D|nr:DUF6509 family protein [Paenibacillus turpanensis]